MATNKGTANGYAPLDGTGKVPTSNLPASTTTPDATTSAKGVVQLSGDLSGTASAPTVPGLAAKIDTAGTGLVKSGTTLRRSASVTGDANLAALPAASLHTGELRRTNDGGIYESDGAAWQVVRDPSGTYAPLTVAGQQALATQRSQVLLPWYAAVANRFYARANVVCIGDSITEGQGADQQSRRWVNRLAANLRLRLPVAGVNGGRGYIATKLTGEDSYTDPVTSAGSGLNFTNVMYSAKRQVTIFTVAGDKATWNLTGTSADICWVRGPSTGTLYYKIDGGSAVTFATSGTLQDGRLTRVALGASGAHTLEIGWSSGGNVYVGGVIEYDGDESAGITVHDAGHYGWDTSTTVGSGSSAGWLQTPTTPERWPAAIAALAPSVLLITLGENDALPSRGITAAQFGANVTSLITIVRAAMTAPYPPIVLQMLYQRGNSPLTEAWANYVAAAQAVAAADSQVTVLDHTLRMPAQSAATTYGLYADTVHPTNIGHSMIADTLTDFLMPR